MALMLPGGGAGVGVGVGGGVGGGAGGGGGVGGVGGGVGDGGGVGCVTGGVVAGGVAGVLSLPPSRPPQPAVSAGMARAAIKIKVFKCLGVWVKLLNLRVLMLWGPVMLVSLDWT